MEAWLRGVYRTVLYDPDGTKHYEYQLRREESGRPDLLMIDALGFLVLHPDVVDWLRMTVKPVDWAVNRYMPHRRSSFSSSHLHLFFVHEHDAVLFETFFG